MIERILSTLQEECLLSREQVILAALSGGPDSLCLVDVLVHSGYPVIAAHFDHGLRPESVDEAKQVEKMAKDLGIRCVFGRQDVGAYAQAQVLTIEEAARRLRYRFLFEQATIFQAQAVCTGHTADDQAETFLLHLLRGAGLDGLSGMAYRSLPNAWSNSIALVRPLLGTWRAEILERLAQRGMQAIEDSSNRDTRYLRNRVRHELLPYLGSYNPRVREALWRTAEVLRADKYALEHLSAGAWKGIVSDQGAGFLALKWQELSSQPPEVQRYLLRRAIQHLRPGLHDVDYAAILRAVRFIQQAQPGAQSDLCAGLRLLREADIVWLASWEADLPLSNWPQLSEGLALALELPGAIQLAHGWRLEAELVDNADEAREHAQNNTDPYQAWLDREQLEAPLQVRSRRPGERIRPLGMGGRSIKLSDLMINARLPERARRNWPIVISGGQVAWIPGLRLCEDFRLQADTKRVVHLALRRESQD